MEQVPISEICEKHGLQPTVFYRWQKEFFENGSAAFQSKARPNHSAEQERIAYLEKKIQTKDEVLAELMAEHVALKKILGTEQRGCLHHAEGHAGRASAGDPRREGPEVGSGAKAAADSPAAGCVIRSGATVREPHISGVSVVGQFDFSAS